MVGIAISVSFWFRFPSGTGSPETGTGCLDWRVQSGSQFSSFRNAGFNDRRGHVLQDSMALDSHTELGFSYAVYQSRTTQTLSVMPAYAAIAYQLPLPFRIQIFLKAGGGGAYLTVRPTNQSGWDPLYFLGTEFSILAGRRLRLGLRLDYNIISEQYSKPPIEAQYPYLFSSSDPRYQNTNYFKMTNGSFFHFGIMISFYM